MGDPDFQCYLDRFIDEYLRNRPPFFALIRPQEAAIFASLRSLVERPVLDFGCGDGFFARVAFGAARIDVGLDLTESRAEEALESGAYRELTTYDGKTIPYPDGSFASVVSNSVLEHVAQLRSNVDEIYRVLTPGGRFLTSVMTDRWEEHLFGAKALGRRYREFMRKKQVHHNLLSLGNWDEVFENAGFEVEREVGYLSPRTSTYMDLMHYLSAPSLLFKALLGRWVVLPGLWVPLARRAVRGMIELPVRPAESSAVFLVLRKPGAET